jgi:hypothetical protein
MDSNQAKEHHLTVYYKYWPEIARAKIDSILKNMH